MPASRELAWCTDTECDGLRIHSIDAILQVSHLGCAERMVVIPLDLVSAEYNLR
eukprot:SAG31_NODE_4721_length_3007_cov_5.646836_2_plen_54_part_00